MGLASCGSRGSRIVNSLWLIAVDPHRGGSISLRPVNTLCQGEASLRDQLVLFQVYHNFVLPHASLRQPLPALIPTHGRGSAKLWRPCTPGMAAGLTDHVWSLKEVLLYRVPPWPQVHVS